MNRHQLASITMMQFARVEAIIKVIADKRGLPYQDSSLLRRATRVHQRPRMYR